MSEGHLLIHCVMSLFMLSTASCVTSYLLCKLQRLELFQQQQYPCVYSVGTCLMLLCVLLLLLQVPDPAAVKPPSWDEEKQGVWLPPPVKNPACIGAPGACGCVCAVFVQRGDRIMSKQLLGCFLQLFSVCLCLASYVGGGGAPVSSPRPPTSLLMCLCPASSVWGGAPASTSSAHPLVVLLWLLLGSLTRASLP